MKKTNTPIEAHLKVFKDRSVLVDQTGKEIVFKEGSPSLEAKARQKKISDALEDGFLEDVIKECRHPDIHVTDLDENNINLIDSLVDAVTSEIGRALVGLSVLQLCIKAIEPSQNIRLHKGGKGDFSWEDGLSMRTIDARHITPTLRKNSLLRVNKDGIMMTRSLAENYPYSYLYKAAMRGAKKEWLELVDQIENEEINPLGGLKIIISSLMRKSDAFLALSIEVELLANEFLSYSPSPDQIKNFIKRHIDISEYSARLLEIGVHSLFQSLSQHELLKGSLKSLSQMRSANKKHGNIGDIEITSSTNDFCIYEAWDCKYGKPYLRDELDELSEKLEIHPETEEVGFIVNIQPDIRDDILRRLEEVSTIHDTKIRILSLDSFVSEQLEKCSNSTINKCAENWLTAYVETLTQKRREIAPVDEPCDVWLASLKTLFLEIKKNN